MGLFCKNQDFCVFRHVRPCRLQPHCPYTKCSHFHNIIPPLLPSQPPYHPHGTPHSFPHGAASTPAVEHPPPQPPYHPPPGLPHDLEAEEGARNINRDIKKFLDNAVIWNDQLEQLFQHSKQHAQLVTAMVGTLEREMEELKNKVNKIIAKESNDNLITELPNLNKRIEAVEKDFGTQSGARVGQLETDNQSPNKLESRQIAGITQRINKLEEQLMGECNNDLTPRSNNVIVTEDVFDTFHKTASITEKIAEIEQESKKSMDRIDQTNRILHDLLRTLAYPVNIRTSFPNIKHKARWLISTFKDHLHNDCLWTTKSCYCESIIENPIWYDPDVDFINEPPDSEDER